MKKLIKDLIRTYEQSLRDMAGANNECQEQYGQDVFPEAQINLVKAILFDLNILLEKTNTEAQE